MQNKTELISVYLISKIPIHNYTLVLAITEKTTEAIAAYLIIIMYIYHALINALSAHIIHINLNVIFYTHVKHSPTKTIYIKYYLKINK